MLWLVGCDYLSQMTIRPSELCKNKFQNIRMCTYYGLFVKRVTNFKMCLVKMKVQNYTLVSLWLLWMNEFYWKPPLVLGRMEPSHPEQGEQTTIVHVEQDVPEPIPPVIVDQARLKVKGRRTPQKQNHADAANLKVTDNSSLFAVFAKTIKGLNGKINWKKDINECFLLLWAALASIPIDIGMILINDISWCVFTHRFIFMHIIYMYIFDMYKCGKICVIKKGFIMFVCSFQSVY